MKLPKESGIYAITNNQTGRAYIGSSIDMHCRMRAHRQSLERGKHINRLFQAEWQLYGSDAFTFAVIEVTSDDDDTLMEVEARYLAAAHHAGLSYNPRWRNVKSGRLYRKV